MAGFPDPILSQTLLYYGQECDILVVFVMGTIAAQKWLTGFVLPTLNVALVSLVAIAVLRQRWVRVRPVLSAYIWFLAITGVAGLLVLYSPQVCSGALQYTICRIYLVGYYVIGFLTCLFAVAVVYEFLFRLAGSDKKIRRTAIIGFLITISFTIALTYALIVAKAGKPRTLEDVARFLFGATALALIPSGIFILVIKKTRSLFLETRLTLVLLALVLYDLIDLLSAFALRGSGQVKVVVADFIWIAFTILLYWGLKNGPPIPDAVADLSASNLLS